MLLAVEGREVYAGTGGRPFAPERPAVVFIHGAGLDHTCWQLQSRWFAWHGWSVLAVDLPGHGRSAGPPRESIGDLVAFVEALLAAARTPKAALVGHSMGAIVALETAAKAPAKVSSLALLGIASSMPVHPNLLKNARENPAAAYDMMAGWCHSPPAKLGGNTVPGLWLTGGTRALLGQAQAGALAVDLAACDAWKSGAEAAAKVHCPALFLSGESDVMTPARKAAELAKLVPGAKSITLRRCGHMMMSEQPDAVLDALIGHLSAA
ncbi:MAG: alpha/beta fold hydrolase [Hyphomicrobiaceae bacterium]